MDVVLSNCPPCIGHDEPSILFSLYIFFDHVSYFILLIYDIISYGHLFICSDTHTQLFI